MKHLFLLHELILQTIAMGVATFGPATALESVTGVTYWVHIIIIIAICTVYTSIVMGTRYDFLFIIFM